MTPIHDGGYLRREPWYRRPSVLVNAALIVAVAALVGEVIRITSTSVASWGASWPAFAVAAVGVFLARRHRWPGLLVILGATLVDALSGSDPITLWTIAVFTAFSVTARGSSAVVVGLVTACVVGLSTAIAGGFELVKAESMAAVTASIAAAAAGSALLNQHQYWRSLEDRTADAILTREIEADRRVAEERLRIARDLHDVVGHEVAIISMHLGVAEVSLPPESERALAALNAARAGVQSVLSETQDILKVLRRGDRPTEEDSKPAPGIAGLETLIASYESVGLTVDAALCPLPRDLDATVDTAVYRIVQEALTNANRHGVGSVDLEITMHDPHIIIRASNPRRPTGAGGDPRVDSTRTTGFGLVGMRERAQSAGGTVEVVSDETSFAVTATVRTDGKDSP